jgi:DNA replication protein DnaC
MPSVFQNLQFAAQSLTFLTPAQLVHRAKLVDADFAASVLCRSIFDLVRDLIAEEALEEKELALREYLKPDLLIIEDFAGKQLPKHSGEYLLEVVMRRYENRSMLITSNRPLEDWGKLFQDVPVATAILDRLLHHSRIITFEGRSYRTKDLDLGGAA